MYTVPQKNAPTLKWYSSNLYRLLLMTFWQKFKVGAFFETQCRSNQRQVMSIVQCWGMKMCNFNERFSPRTVDRWKFLRTSKTESAVVFWTRLVVGGSKLCGWEEKLSTSCIKVGGNGLKKMMQIWHEMHWRTENRTEDHSRRKCASNIKNLNQFWTSAWILNHDEQLRCTDHQWNTKQMQQNYNH